MEQVLREYPGFRLPHELAEKLEGLHQRALDLQLPIPSGFLDWLTQVLVVASVYAEREIQALEAKMKTIIEAPANSLTQLDAQKNQQEKKIVLG